MEGEPWARGGGAGLRTCLNAKCATYHTSLGPGVLLVTQRGGSAEGASSPCCAPGLLRLSPCPALPFVGWVVVSL